MAAKSCSLRDQGSLSAATNGSTEAEHQEETRRPGVDDWPATAARPPCDTVLWRGGSRPYSSLARVHVGREAAS